MIEDTKGHQLRMLQRAGEERYARSTDQTANRSIGQELRKEMEARLTEWEASLEGLEATDGLSPREIAMYEAAMVWGAMILYSLKDEAQTRGLGLHIYLRVYQNRMLHWQSIDIL